MKAYIVSKMNGTSTKPGFIVPKLYDYMKNFEVKASTGATITSWCVCIVDDASAVPVAAQSDSNLIIMDTDAELDLALSTAERNAVNSKLAATSWGVTAVSGDTRRSVLGKIRAAVGDSIESWGLGV